MVESVVGVKKILLLLVIMGFCGCNKAASYITVVGPNTQSQSPATVQSTPANSALPSASAAPEPEITTTPTPDQPAAELNKEDVEDPPEPVLEVEDPAAENSVLTPTSNLIKNASWVMLHEGKKLGTACNAFVRRVLEISGFSPADFLANDFDLYAKKYIRSYKAVDFKNDVAGGAEIARLKSHLWSYPERTPFIMQWSRSGMHGHIAIVERIKDQLITYQANLNKYTARKGTTTVQSLLSGFNRRVLTVYTELKK